MRSFIGAHQVVCVADFIELGLGLDDPPPPLGGIDRDLFRGPLAAETGDERAARLDAAADVLADLFEQGKSDEVAALDAAYADALSRSLPLRLGTARRRRTRREAAA